MAGYTKMVYPSADGYPSKY